MGSEFMAPRPPANTNRLGGQRLEQIGSGDWSLLLPAYYAWVFSVHYPTLVAAAAVDEVEPGSGERRWLWHSLDDGLAAAVNGLLEALHRLVIIDPKVPREDPLACGLDQAAALDFNYHSGGRRTGLGQLEYRAKYQQSPQARAILGEHMARSLPLLPRRFPEVPTSIAGVPSRRRRTFQLAAELATRITSLANEWNLLPTPLSTVEVVIAARKSEAKSLSMAGKRKLWTRLLEADALAMSGSVRGQTVYVVDDLYQSGITLGSVASYLKSRGALEVIGLAAVKSLSNTDNL
ncbi:MAG: phosphoribosyltransferase family protein [bacterium]